MHQNCILMKMERDMIPYDIVFSFRVRMLVVVPVVGQLPTVDVFH